MNVATRIGIAVGAGALGTLGAGLAIGAMRDRFDEGGADVRRQTADARSEFDAWNAKLQERFPGGKLDTPQEHAAFEKFLAQEPAPTWLNPTHEGFTTVHTAPTSIVDWPNSLSSDAPGAGIGFALVGAVGGVTALGAGLRGMGGSNLATAGLIAGGAAGLSIGAIAGYFDIGQYNADTGTDARAKLITDATMPRAR